MILHKILAATVFSLFITVANSQILIGQTAGTTGAVAATVNEAILGARLYIDNVNAKGGINGEKIELLTLDDKFDPKLAAENARTLIVEKKVVALFLNRGTPHTEAIMPLLQEYGIALVAPSTGAMVLRSPVNHYIFNVRSTYQREAEKAITHLQTLGLTRIAVVHVDDSFGLDGFAGATKGFVKAQLKPAVVIKADRSKPDYSVIIPMVVKSNAQAVIWIGSGTAVSEGIKALRDAGSAAQVVTLSNNASSGFIKQLGTNSRGVIITQVFPYERSIAHPLVKEFLSLSRAKGIQDATPAMLEGFAGAKVLVEGLRLASPKITREKLVLALESIKRFDLGGLEVSYSKDDHTGLNFADLSIIGKDGKFQR